MWETSLSLLRIHNGREVQVWSSYSEVMGSSPHAIGFVSLAISSLEACPLGFRCTKDATVARSLKNTGRRMLHYDVRTYESNCLLAVNWHCLLLSFSVCLGVFADFCLQKNTKQKNTTRFFINNFLNTTQQKQTQSKQNIQISHHAHSSIAHQVSVIRLHI